MDISNFVAYGCFPLSDDRNIWLERSLPRPVFDQLASVPDEMRETLYPEIFMFGPHGMMVTKMADDWRARQSNGSEVCNHIETESLVGHFNRLDMGYFLHFFEEVTAGNLENNIWDVVEDLDLTPAKYSLNNEAFFAVLAWIAFEGFVDETKGSTIEGRKFLSDARIAAARLLRIMKLNAKDYLAKDFDSSPKVSRKEFNSAVQLTLQH